jgi:hypothetical protein
VSDSSIPADEYFSVFYQVILAVLLPRLAVNFSQSADQSSMRGGLGVHELSEVQSSLLVDDDVEEEEDEPCTSVVVFDYSVLFPLDTSLAAKYTYVISAQFL